MNGSLRQRPGDVPRGALLGAGALIALAIGGVLLGGRAPTQTPFDAPVEAPLAEGVVTFADRADGAVVMRAAGTGDTLYVIEPGTNGFVRGVLRSLARERRAHEVGHEPPFRLSAWRDGRFELVDPSTGRVLDLRAFGPTNEGAFRTLLAAALPSRAEISTP